MKKICLCALTSMALFTMSSCRSAKETATISELGGEWSIVEIKNEKVAANAEGNVPTLIFDVENGKLSGFSGCNRVMGTFDLTTPAGEINLSSIATTRMSCPDMSVEQNILSALSQVKTFKTVGDSRVVLCDGKKSKVMTLNRRVLGITLEQLNGKWNITEVNGDAIPAGMENEPFIEFNVAEKTIHGNAGCNIFNGTLQTETYAVSSIMFPGTITTMMSCPDLALEGQILEALNSVRSYDERDGALVLFNEGNEIVLKMKKQG